MIALSKQHDPTEPGGASSPSSSSMRETALLESKTSSPSMTQRQEAASSYAQVSHALQNEAERLFNDRQYEAAERFVRQLLQLQHRVVGEKHEDYALGLSMLGELRFLQGDPRASEQLFRQALAIRAETLGRRHPDYAVSLACLAGVVWRRGELVEAERLLREAVEIRVEALGASHPESIQSRKELVRILRERGDWAGALSLVRSTRQVDEVHGHFVVREDLEEQVVALAEEFDRLSGILTQSASRMMESGVPTSEQELARMKRAAQRFEELRHEVFDRVEMLQVPDRPHVTAETLHHLATLLDDLAEAEHHQAELETMREEALTVLDQVLTLTYNGHEDPSVEVSALHDCLEDAQHLRDVIAAKHWLQLPAQTETLANGTHVYVALLILVEELAELSDQDWADLHEEVRDVLGLPIAQAASSARLSVGPKPASAERVLLDAHHPDPAPAIRPDPTPKPSPVQSTTPPFAGPVSPKQDRLGGMIRELAVASLVPTMGRVINLPSASPEEEVAQRLLRNGYAPNVIEASLGQIPAPGVNPIPQRPNNRTEVEPSVDTTRPRLAVVAGPLSLPSLPSAQLDLGARLEQMLLAPHRRRLHEQTIAIRRVANLHNPSDSREPSINPI